MIQYLNDVSQVWWQWMGSMFWQVSLLIVIVTALDMMIRKWAWPQVRYALWALVFIKLVISPAWQMPTSIISLIQPQVQEQITFNVDMGETEKLSANFFNPDEIIVKQVTWQSYALLAWISGIIIFTLMLLRKMFQFRKLHQVDGREVIPEWFNELMTKTGTQLKLKKQPSVIYSKGAKSPAVYGVFRPVLLLPEGYIDKLSKEQAEHILIHELYHIKRGDLLAHWICVSLQIVYWFNPLLIWTRRQMRYVCEICCDLSVAGMLREKTGAYRETLLRTARELFAVNMEPSLGFLGIFEEPFRLVPRLKWL
ncbi:MAG: M56 family metallopeptidase, partial [Desulfatiglans sp.]|nr:M56 family metallopeptidase [Desulfatiglans sp.]